MRRGYECKFLENENGEFFGINLGADFCAEHEYGIKNICQAFKLSEEKDCFGIEKRRINFIPEEFIFEKVKLKNKNYFALIYDISTFCMRQLRQNNSSSAKDWISGEIFPRNNDDLTCAWDGRGFGVLASKEHKDKINLLHQAFLSNDVAIGVSGSGVFSNGGLVLAIISKMDKEILEDLYNQDLDYYNLQQEAKATGIYEILDKCGKGRFEGYFALSPRWKDDKKDDIVFWLNPYDQKKYNSGWFTFKDLIDWTKGKGRICIKE
jgi:hypothetical protein